jgi:GNAT superfamily N-acetyltransferase
VIVSPLREEELPEAAALLRRALPHDPGVETVAREKLFGACPAPHTTDTLAAREGTALLGVAVRSGRWLRVLAVDPDRRLRGVGSALLAECEQLARAAGQTKLRTCDQPGNYLSPGIDERYVETVPFLQHNGYSTVASYENLRVPLAPIRPLPTRTDFTIRRAGPEDRDSLLECAGSFAKVWAFEIARAFEIGAVHVALDGDRVVAFAAHDGNNRGLGWFGPAGTLESHRGKGLGAALLIPCLIDVREAGLTDGVIAWIGPREFYAKTAGAVSDRKFVVLEKPL